MTKPTKWRLRPAMTQISLGIRPVWSESSLFAWKELGYLATHWAHSEDSDQTGQMPRLIWVFSGRTCHFVGFVMYQIKWLQKLEEIFVFVLLDIYFRFRVKFIQIVTFAERAPKHKWLLLSSTERFDNYVSWHSKQMSHVHTYVVMYKCLCYY